MHLKKKSTIVTGAASGIGRAIALKFAAEGAVVIAADIDGAAAESVAEEIRFNGGTAHGIATDITNRTEVESMTAMAVNRSGSVDVLINLSLIHI